jgi:PAS domain S-box-containing protein
LRAFWKDASLNVKLSLLAASSVIAMAAVLNALAFRQSAQYHGIAKREVSRLISQDIDHITEGVYNLVRTEDEAVQQQVNGNLNVARHVLAGAGELTLSDDILNWSAIEQFSGRAMTLRLPRMLVGGRWLGTNDDPAVETPVVDKIVRMVGGTATIFQRMNRAGDMLRVATTVIEAGGRRAIGTYIPAVGPGASPNPVIATVMKGGTYHGRAFVVDAWYLTAYEPLIANTGEIVGMLYVGVKMENVVSRIRKAIIGTSVGKTGYVYVLGGTGQQRGRYIISHRGERDGEDILESRDTDGRPIIQEIIAAAMSLDPGKMTTVRYRWQNPGEREPRWKIARLVYYAPWDWVIGTSAYEDEFQAYWEVLSAGRSQMLVVMGWAGLAITAIVGLLGALLGWWTIVRPIRRMTGIMEKIADGSLNQTLEVRHHDEIGVLARVFNTMTQKLGQSFEGLRESEAKYRQIFEEAMEGLFQSTLEGRFTHVNPAMTRILGYDSAEDLIDSILDIRTHLYVRPDDRDQLLSDLWRQGYVLGREVQVRRKDGQVIWVSLNTRIRYDTAGCPLTLEGFLIDVSEKKREEQKRLKLEEQLGQAQKMETIGLLAGGIAHDFNNLLTVISGFTELALSRTAASKELQNDLHEINQATERAATLTSQLLAFSRKQILQPRIIDLGELLVGMKEMLKRLLGESIYVQIRQSPRDLWRVRVDPRKIEQVVLNLAANARDAMPNGGVLSIEASNVVLNDDYTFEHVATKKGEYVLLTVGDTGHGMDADTRQRIFEPFFTTKGENKGTGLGLSTVYGIVKQSEGFIFCYSEVGKGTTFKAYFPRVHGEPQQLQQPEDTGAQPLQGSEAILLVEDNESVRRLTTSILESGGYSVFSASSGGEALQMLSARSLSFDLLLTDVIMPGMGGKELARTVSKIFPAVEVLFMSGHTADAIVHNGALEQGVEFIQKPFARTALLRKIREILDRPKSAPKHEA